jgi:uncharacterized protein DUF6559
MQRAQPSRHPLLRPFAALAKRSALKRYLRRLPAVLIEDYGHGGPYWPAQVDAAVRRHRFPLKQVAYAQALFCDQAELGDAFEAIRAELAKRYFSGNLNFTRAAVAAYEPQRWRFDDSGQWQCSGGEDGGSVGGGH